MSILYYIQIDIVKQAGLVKLMLIYKNKLLKAVNEAAAIGLNPTSPGDWLIYVTKGFYWLTVFKQLHGLTLNLDSLTLYILALL